MPKQVPTKNTKSINNHNWGMLKPWNSLQNKFFWSFSSLRARTNNYQQITKNDYIINQKGIQNEKPMNKQVYSFSQKHKPNRFMERPMVEKGLRVNETLVRFADKGSPHESKNHHLWETGDHIRLAAWSPRGFYITPLYFPHMLRVSFSPGRDRACRHCRILSFWTLLGKRLL